MVNNLALGIYPASASAWIYTFKVTTCFVSWTLGVGRAFRFALGVGISKISSDTGAGRSSLLVRTTLRV